VFIQESLNKVGCLFRKIQYQDKQPHQDKHLVTTGRLKIWMSINWPL